MDQNPKWVNAILNLHTEALYWVKYLDLNHNSEPVFFFYIYIYITMTIYFLEDNSYKPLQSSTT